MIQAPDIIVGFLDGLRPAKHLLPSEWADQYRYLSSRAASEPGQWRTSRTPYLKEIMDCFDTHSQVREVVIMKGAQLGLTEAGYNVLGYFIDTDPGPLMYVGPTEGVTKRNTKMRFDPMIEASPTLSTKIGKAKSRDSSNTISQKNFPGGVIIFAGANSAASLRSVPIRVIVFDETDAFPIDLEGEGSPIELGMARTRTFSNKKVLKISTPTLADTSVIASEFESTDQRYFNVPCPHCGTMQPLEWERLEFDKTQDPITHATYNCIGCDEPIEERHKPRMLALGKWIPRKPENADPLRVGYHINSFYSPLGWYSWAEAAQQFMIAYRENDQSKLKVFVNTVRGLPWTETITTPKAEDLYARRGGYRSHEVAADVAMLTCGVDVQADRLELEIVGWCPGMRSRSILYAVLPGNTTEEQVWEDLTRVLYRGFERADGATIGISKMCIDSGYNTQNVYAFCRKHPGNLVVPIKGQANDRQKTMLRPPQVVQVRADGKKVGNTALWTIGVSMIKQEVYGRLLQTLNEDGTAPAGYCHFPEDYDISYFHMLASERIVTRVNTKGYTEHVWEKIQARNEALDCRVYARAGAEMLGMSRWKESNWRAAIGNSYTPKAPKDTTEAPPKRKRKKNRESIWS